MSDEKLQAVIQLSMSPEEAQLVCWSLAHGVAIFNGDIVKQLESGSNIASMINNMDEAKFAAFTERLIKVSDAAQAASQSDKECEHCECDDVICCWCKGVKGL